jgi:hypothetical protein
LHPPHEKDDADLTPAKPRGSRNGVCFIVPMRMVVKLQLFRCMGVIVRL